VRALFLVAAVAALGGLLGCHRAALSGEGPPPRDMSFVFPAQDLLALNACGTYAARCYESDYGAPFPLAGDPGPDPNESDDGVVRDQNGDLTLGRTNPPPDALWLANTADIYNKGTVSKMDSKAIKEVARYFSVTCSSNAVAGPKDICDGMKGCCARDSYPQWVNRKNNQPSGRSQQVNLDSNYPSRTAIDFNGDAWISNRAFGFQSSVSKIASDPKDCIDRNKNGKIDTSSDVDGDGAINADCNGDGLPDDIAGVKAQPCTNGKAQEFYGYDDECVLFTTNTDAADSWGRPLALGRSAQGQPADAWAGLYNNGHFFRIDGTTGLTTDEVHLPQGCQPYGLAVDSSGYAWATNLSQPPLCYFNTAKNTDIGTAVVPTVGQLEGYGIGLDRDQNVWIACLSFGACRYTPDRSNGFTKLGNGHWTMIQAPGQNGGGGYAIGVAVDSRSQNEYFAWVTGGPVVTRIPASALPLPNGADTLVNGAAYPTANIAGSGKGVGVDRDQNVWNISQTSSVATRIKVDAMGTMTQPSLDFTRNGAAYCPGRGGDACAWQGPNQWDPGPYTYSDFTGFGLRNFTNPSGRYSYLVEGCSAHGGGTTTWLRVTFQADVPQGTTFAARARSGLGPGSQSFGAWTSPAAQSPVDLETAALEPNQTAGYDWLEVELDFGTAQAAASPRLDAFAVYFDCE
jgi:hypothetical protein